MVTKKVEALLKKMLCIDLPRPMLMFLQSATPNNQLITGIWAWWFGRGCSVGVFSHGLKIKNNFFIIKKNKIFLFKK